MGMPYCQLICRESLSHSVGSNGNRIGCALPASYQGKSVNGSWALLAFTGHEVHTQKAVHVPVLVGAHPVALQAVWHILPWRASACVVGVRRRVVALLCPGESIVFKFRYSAKAGTRCLVPRKSDRQGTCRAFSIATPRISHPKKKSEVTSIALWASAV
jgi:hypothetical protein